MQKSIEIFNVQNVSKTIKNENVLKNISFNGTSSQITGLVGPNGSGKTTLMKAMLGLIKFSGTIDIADKRVSFNDHAILSKVGSLIEDPAIYPFLTGREHLECFSNLKDKDRQADIDGIIKQLSLGKFIDKKASSYSLGMRQKLGIAISFLNNPALVILDEPMNALDVHAIRELREVIISKKSQGTSFIISSHLLSELEKVADQLVVIKNGESILNLPLDDFKKIEIFSLETEQKEKLYKVLTLNSIPYSTTPENVNIALAPFKRKNLLDLLEVNNIIVNRIIKKSTDGIEDTFLQFIY